jgi:hypothetical protein
MRDLAMAKRTGKYPDYLAPGGDGGVCQCAHQTTGRASVNDPYPVASEALAELPGNLHEPR